MEDVLVSERIKVASNDVVDIFGARLHVVDFLHHVVDKLVHKISSRRNWRFLCRRSGHVSCRRRGSLPVGRRRRRIDAAAGARRRRYRNRSGVDSGRHRRFGDVAGIARRIRGDHARPVRHLRQPERFSVSAGSHRRRRRPRGDRDVVVGGDPDGRGRTGDRIRRFRAGKRVVPTGSVQVDVVGNHLLGGVGAPADDDGRQW